MSAPAAIHKAAPVIYSTAWPQPLPRARTTAELRSVTKRYGKTIALNNLSPTLHAGEVVALLEPNGAGKTTAVRLLLGLISADSGSVRLLDRDPRDSDARTRIGAML